MTRFSSTKYGLVVVDMQNDFVSPEGSLYIKGAERLIDGINIMMQECKNYSVPIFATQDFHPADHVSFRNNGHFSKWPKHCIAGSPGASFHPDLDVNLFDEIIRKGMNRKYDSYSGFSDDGGNETRFMTLLKANYSEVDTLWICGVATDYCVKATALDAIKRGYKVVILQDLIAAVNVNSQDGSKSIVEMAAAGCIVMSSKDVFGVKTNVSV